MLEFETYHCPRCKNFKIIEYSDTFDCPSCQLEFEKGDFEQFDEENVLAIEEKLEIFHFILD